MTTQSTNRSHFYFQSYLENTSIYNVNSSIGQSRKKVAQKIPYLPGEAGGTPLKNAPWLGEIFYQGRHFPLVHVAIFQRFM